MTTPPFIIGRKQIQPGKRRTINLPLARLYTSAQLKMPVHIIHGREPGHRLFVCAAIHGDELNGISIVHRLLNHTWPDNLRGTLLLIPVVNIYGLITHSRYLPDRRDLNREFPGRRRGSLAGRLAALFMREVAAKCSHGIDLHTGSNHRTNLPQIRANLQHPPTAVMAQHFGAPLILDAASRDGSLRAALARRHIPVLVYEAGEALRFDNEAIQVGFEGVLRVMQGLEMLDETDAPPPPAQKPIVAQFSQWVRAGISGLFYPAVAIGEHVVAHQQIGQVNDPLGDRAEPLTAPFAGRVIGLRNLPLVYQGDALMHIAGKRE